MALQRVKPLERILAEGNAKNGLERTLGPWTLTAMGLGAIIGTGVFVLTGIAAATKAGPALSISFIIAGIVSALGALCYAEMAGKIPISGSAYSYTYATLGEFWAWLIGWDLLLEYGIGAATVSIGWSAYFAHFLQTAFGVNLPSAWLHAPSDHIPGFANLPAAFIVLAISTLLARGTRESSQVNMAIVIFKVAVILLFTVVGISHINPANWSLPPGPDRGMGGYFPFGWEGTLAGAAFIFYAYIGFDAVAAAAEECKAPKRDLPFAILMSLSICTVLYIIVSLILTGMVPFNELNVPSPVAFAVLRAGMPWAGLIISAGALAGLTSVLLVGMFAQSRVFYAIARDGLLPAALTRIHPKWHTPAVPIFSFGIIIALAAAFTPIRLVGALANMGTLCSFILVSLAVPILRKTHPELSAGSFEVPFGPWIIPMLSALTAFGLMTALALRSDTFFHIPISWLTFILWMLVGTGLYHVYGRHASVMAREEEKAA